MSAAAYAAYLLAQNANGDITTALANWYKFDESTGQSNKADSGSQGVTLQWFGTGSTPTAVTGFIGPYALQCSGSDQVRAKDGDGGNADLSGDITISVWYNKAAGNTNARLNIWTDSTHAKTIQFVMNHSGTEVSVASTDGSAFTATDSASTWHHVMGLYTNGVCSAAYLDNVLMTSTYPASTFALNDDTGRSYGSKSGGGNKFTGTFDDGRRYTRLLSAADRAALFAYR